MDASGDFLPYVLRDLLRAGGQLSSPKSEPKPGVRQTAQPLHIALDDWMHYIRTGDRRGDDQTLHEIEITSMKDVLLEFTLKSFGGESHALADSGFGYSQLLPILVRGLIAPHDSTVAVEQPELSLESCSAN
jgi:predicted ATPase